MAKLMFITVGTSLFTSATWDPSRLGFPKSLRSYRGAVEEGRCFLTSPKERERHAAPREELEQEISAENAGEWSAWLPGELYEGRHRVGTANRYSAELATVLRLVEQEGEGRSARSFLAEYTRVFVVADPSFYCEKEDRRQSYVAACHLQRYLSILCGDAHSGVELLKTRGLASPDPAELIGNRGETGLGLLLKNIVERRGDLEARNLDLVVTGGFKVYGYVLSPLLDRFEVGEVRLIYGHEMEGDLVMMDRHSVSIRGHRFRRKLHEDPAPGT